MVKGRGKGGPLDGVPIEAAADWEGRIRKHDRRGAGGDANAIIRYHEGRYVWNSFLGSWIWVATDDAKHTIMPAIMRGGDARVGRHSKKAP